MTGTLRGIEADVIACRACPRLVTWREHVGAREGRALRGSGVLGQAGAGVRRPAARMLILGLAPAAHGGNRTGRIFTGDRSGDCLFASLHRCGVANQATSEARGDGLQLRCAYVSAVNRCARPGNKPTPQERDTCLPFLEREIAALARLRVIVALGAFAWDGAVQRSTRSVPDKPKPRFGHAAEAEVDGFTLVGSLPSQPAEHLHRQAHVVHARRHLRACAEPGGLSWRLTEDGVRRYRAGIGDREDG